MEAAARALAPENLVYQTEENNEYSVEQCLSTLAHHRGSTAKGRPSETKSSRPTTLSLTSRLALASETSADVGVVVREKHIERQCAR
jgi:hypothetical protein